MKLVWSSHAVKQLDGVGAYIAADNPAAAQKLLKAIRKSAQHLKKNPFMGRRTEFADVRELVVHPNYLLTYRVSQDSVEIAQVWHAAQRRYH